MTTRMLSYGRMVEDAPMSGQHSVDADTTTGLTFGLTGGLIREDAAVATVAAGTVTLTDNTTNYVKAFAGAYGTGTTPDQGLLYKVTTSGGAITAIVDCRMSYHTDNTSFV